MADTVRERILKQWKKNLDNLMDGSSLAFETVSRAPLDRIDFAGMKACALIDEGENVAVYEVGYLEIDMIVSVEFWVRMEVGSDPSSELNHLTGLITKEFLIKINTDEDVTNAQLSLNIKQGGLQFDIDGPKDQYVAGVRQFIITYRTGKQDPYDLR